MVLREKRPSYFLRETSMWAVLGVCWTVRELLLCFNPQGLLSILLKLGMNEGVQIAFTTLHNIVGT